MKILTRILNKTLFGINEKYFKEWSKDLSMDIQFFIFNQKKFFGEIELIFENKDYHVHFSYEQENFVKFDLNIKIFNKNSENIFNKLFKIENFKVGYPNERDLCLAIYNMIK